MGYSNATLKTIPDTVLCCSMPKYKFQLCPMQWCDNLQSTLYVQDQTQTFVHEDRHLPRSHPKQSSRQQPCWTWQQGRKHWHQRRRQGRRQQSSWSGIRKKVWLLYCAREKVEAYKPTCREYQKRRLLEAYPEGNES